eukprot:166464-Amphidinium_carterae.1
MTLIAILDAVDVLYEREDLFSTMEEEGGAEDIPCEEADEKMGRQWDQSHQCCSGAAAAEAPEAVQPQPMPTTAAISKFLALCLQGRLCQSHHGWDEHLL